VISFGGVEAGTTGSGRRKRWWSASYQVPRAIIKRPSGLYQTRHAAKWLDGGGATQPPRRQT